MLNTNDPYLAYYRHQQVGGAVSSVYRGGGGMSVYRGGGSTQHGHGIGSFLGGLFRSALPILKSGAAAVGKEALRSGVGFLQDIATTGNARAAANSRLKEFTGGLKRRADDKLERVLQGRGVVAYKKRRVGRVTPQSLANLLRVRMNRVSAATVQRKKKKNNRRKSAKKHRCTTRIVGAGKKRQQKKKKKKSSKSKKRSRKTTRRQDIFG